MDFGPYRYNQQSQATRPPSVFFDGTRLGLEATMYGTLVVSGLAGLHIGLSVTLGYAVRYADGLPAESRAFALFGFILVSLLAMIALAMVLFFASAIPTMSYSIGLVWLMLRWLGKRWGREKLASTLIGAALGLLVGLLGTTLGALLIGLRFDWATYTTMFRWPAILSIDGIALLWLTLYPLISAGADAHAGWRLGKQLEELTLYWYWR
jgi:hypothetical protein